MGKKAALIGQALQRAEKRAVEIQFDSVDEFLNYKFFTLRSINEALNFCRFTSVSKTDTFASIEELTKIGLQR